MYWHSMWHTILAFFQTEKNVYEYLMEQYIFSLCQRLFLSAKPNTSDIVTTVIHELLA